MSHDPIVEEVRAAREAYGAQFGFDLDAIHRDLKEQEAKGGRRVVKYAPRRIQKPAPSQAPICAPAPVTPPADSLSP